MPAYAVLDAPTLDTVEGELAGDGAEGALDKAFTRFEDSQPALSNYVSDLLGKPLDETALALGYFLTIAVWLAFERRFDQRLGPVTSDALEATEQALRLEEELRAEHSEEPLDVDDVVAMEQPAVLRFVHGHVDAALEVQSDGQGDVDVDDVHAIYRAVIVLTLALSQAVKPPTGAKSQEFLA